MAMAPIGVHERRADGLNANAAEIGAQQPRGGILKAQNLRQLRVECLHDAMPGHRFMQDVLDFRELVLARAGCACGRERPIRRAEVMTTGTKSSSSQLSRPPSAMTRAAVKRKVKNCWRKSPRTVLTAF